MTDVWIRGLVGKTNQSTCFSNTYCLQEQATTALVTGFQGYQPEAPFQGSPSSTRPPLVQAFPSRRTLRSHLSSRSQSSWLRFLALYKCDSLFLFQSQPQSGSECQRSRLHTQTTSFRGNTSICPLLIEVAVFQPSLEASR